MRLRILFLVLAMAVSACTGNTAPEPTQPSPTSGTTASTVAPTTTSTTTTTEPVDPLQAAFDSLVATTEALRFLEFSSPPVFELLSSREFNQRVDDLVSSALDTEVGSIDEQLYQLLGILEQGASLENIYSAIAQQQTGAFYDSVTKSIVLIETDVPLSVIERTTLVHELVHALTDEHFGTARSRVALQNAGFYDEQAALAALAEGDASFVEGLYIDTLSDAEHAELVAGYAQIDTTAFRATPNFLQESLIGPYVDGLEFVLSVIDSTGFAGLDEVYENPPTTSEQVRHPEAYASGDSGRAFDLDPILVDGYEAVTTSVWGESAFIGLFGGELLSDISFAGAEGWNGDRFEVLSDGSDLVFRLIYYGDTFTDDEEFFDAMTEFLALAVSPDSFAEAWRTGESVVVVVTSDKAVGPVVFGQMDF